MAFCRKTKQKKVPVALIIIAIVIVGIIIISAVSKGNKDDRSSKESETEFTTEISKGTEETKKDDSVTESKEEDTKKEDETQTEQESSDTKSSDTASVSSDAIRPEIKEAIDSYEAFVDSYCEFMKNYDASDLTMLTKYADLMSKDYEMAQKFEDIENQDLTDAEANYYAQVSLRCSQKMLEASQSMY